MNFQATYEYEIYVKTLAFRRGFHREIAQMNQENSTAVIHHLIFDRINSPTRSRENLRDFRSKIAIFSSGKLPDSLDYGRVDTYTRKRQTTLHNL